MGNPEKVEILPETPTETNPEQNLVLSCQKTGHFVPEYDMPLKKMGRPPLSGRYLRPFELAVHSEIGRIPALLQLLDIAGIVVAWCQTKQ